MHHINWYAYKQNMNSFAQECNDNHVKSNPVQFTKSKGAAITEINNCLVGYDYFRVNVNKLYESTLKYIQKAYDNLQSCEADNSIDL